MGFLNMLSEAKKEVNGGKRFRFFFGFVTSFTDMSIVMKGNDFSVVRINTGGADTGTAKIACHVFDEFFQIVIAL